MLSKMAHFASQNASFYLAKAAVLQRKTTCCVLQNESFYTARRLILENKPASPRPESGENSIFRFSFGLSEMLKFNEKYLQFE